MKCFITKLNGVVQNPRLAKINEMNINVSPSGRNALLSFSAGTEIYTQNGEKVLSAVKDGDVMLSSFVFDENNTKVYLKSYNSVVVCVKNKVSLNLFYLECYDKSNVFDFDMDNLKFSKLLEEIKINGANTNQNSDIAFFSNLNSLKFIHIDTNNLVGNLDAFTSLSNLIKVEIESTLLEGDISVFDKCTKLEILYLQGNQVKGSIKKLCESLHANGKNSGNVVFKLDTTSVVVDESTPCSGTVTATFSKSGVSYNS